MITCIDKNNKHFAYHYQKIMIMKELHKCFGDNHLVGKETIPSDNVFINTNIGIYFHMDATEFEGLLYTYCSEKSSII